jgi:large subunit ribosomal protein L18
MSQHRNRKDRRLRIRRRYRGTIRGTAARPRLTVYRSLRYLYAQVIDDERGVTLASASTLEKVVADGLEGTGNLAAGKKLGEVIAERAKEKGLETVVFDRGGFAYHGAVRAIADAARAAGLKL